MVPSWSENYSDAMVELVSDGVFFLSVFGWMVSVLGVGLLTSEGIEDRMMWTCDGEMGVS